MGKRNFELKYMSDRGNEIRDHNSGSNWKLAAKLIIKELMVNWVGNMGRYFTMKLVQFGIPV